MFVVVLIAIYVVGLFLFWDVCNVEGSLDELMDRDLYATEYAPESSTRVEIAFDGKTLTSDEELLVQEFFIYWYAGLGAMKPEKIARLYSLQTNSELFDELAFDYETALLRNCPIDMSFGSCTLNVKVTRRHAVPKTGKVEIDLVLSGDIAYNSSARHSEVRSESHSFVLLSSGKNLQIEEHTTDRPSYVFANYGLDRVLASNRLVRSDLNYTFFPKYTAPALEMLNQEMSDLVFGQPARSTYPTAEFEYDRRTAANAAINGFSSSGAFGTYDENDANFVSRCIFESGIPMDSQGGKHDQWKWYDEEINTERKKTGCSKSWFDREAFYRYIRDNEGFGMVALQTTTGGGEIGDVIQLMHNGDAVAEFMITGIMADENGNVKDYLVSNDRYSSVSLRTLGCTDLRVIHIVGYNTANI